MQVLRRMLEDLSQRRFYGSVTLKFEAGKVVYVRKEETLKLHDLIAENI